MLVEITVQGLKAGEDRSHCVTKLLVSPKLPIKTPFSSVLPFVETAICPATPRFPRAALLVLIFMTHDGKNLQ
ncbi:hypothetical protein AQUCO_02400098v1 [Aquilegia coerulea]|uniref:Uncharacterized protein n=1 Tax=Aquilegia coerulea TaxID=218851 RepID=A0A2G5DBF4_AQUCA|nr:hypothetical protein AQUCO_02400098v1 [Aquilegia coerulea]